MAVATVLLSAVGYLATVANAYRILAYEPSSAYSHWNVMSAVLESLLDAGHEVVCVTLYPTVTGRLAGHPNYTHVDPSSLAGRPKVWSQDLDYSQMRSLFSSTAFMIGIGTDRAQRMCAMLSGVPEMRDILDGDGRKRYDAVVVESLFSVCPQSLLSGRLRLPTVYVVTTSPVNWMPMAMGSPDHPSYLGTLLTGHPTPVTFLQRLWNTMDYVYTNSVRRYRDTLSRNDDHDRRLSTARNTMMFVNAHHSIEPARPLGPDVLEIGGIHLKRPHGTLSRGLLDVMDKSDEYGVIVFTVGSLVAMRSLPDSILDTFKFVFSQLPQTIIWKYENDRMTDKPNNVVLYKWLPQRDVLQHPNVKLFISHGGISGMYEAVEACVPVLGVPLFYDQPRNVQNLVNLGMALSLDVNHMNHTTILSAINLLLNDRRFAENTERVSSMFRDRHTTPADSVVYWTEYLIRHGEKANIKPFSADASWISHLMIDLCTALAVITFSILFFTRTISRKILLKLKPSLTRN